MLTVPSSLLLLLGLMMPTLRVCGHNDAPIQWPPFWGPHLIAGVVFAATLFEPWRLRGLALALRILFVVVLGVTGSLLFPPVCFAIVLIVPPSRTPETMVARVAVLTGALSAVWFGALASDPDGLWGAWCSLIASIGMTIGGIWWWIEGYLASRPDDRHRELGGDRSVV